MLEWLAIGLIGAWCLWEAIARRRARDVLRVAMHGQQVVIDAAIEVIQKYAKLDLQIAEQVRANAGILRSHQVAIESANEIFQNQVTINRDVLDQLAAIQRVIESAAGGTVLRAGNLDDSGHPQPGTIRAVDPEQCIADLNTRLKELEALVDTMVTGSLPDDHED